MYYFRIVYQRYIILCDTSLIFSEKNNLQHLSNRNNCDSVSVVDLFLIYSVQSDALAFSCHVVYVNNAVNRSANESSILI
jgi:hypothetical protein